MGDAQGDYRQELSMPKKPVVKIYEHETDEWIGVYVDGQLRWQGDSDELTPQIMLAIMGYESHTTHLNYRNWRALGPGERFPESEADLDAAIDMVKHPRTIEMRNGLDHEMTYVPNVGWVEGRLRN